MPEINALANKVKIYRKSIKKNQTEFSDEAGISIYELSLIERGRANPRLSTLQNIAAYMGITVAELLDIEDS